MPAIIDKEKMRWDIIMAFERCIETKPLSNISLRDIATEAGMTHPKLLNYFQSKNDLIVHYCKYTKDYMTEHCKTWFLTHDRKNYDSNLNYLNAFMEYVAEGNSNENRPNATTQFYVLGYYDSTINQLIQNEFQDWKDTMTQCLIEIYGKDVGEKEAEVMMILVSGTFVCNYNKVLSGRINQDLLTNFATLINS